MLESKEKNLKKTDDLSWFPSFFCCYSFGILSYLIKLLKSNWVMNVTDRSPNMCLTDMVQNVHAFRMFKLSIDLLKCASVSVIFSPDVPSTGCQPGASLLSWSDVKCSPHVKTSETCFKLYKQVLDLALKVKVYIRKISQEYFSTVIYCHNLERTCLTFSSCLYIKIIQP